MRKLTIFFLLHLFLLVPAIASAQRLSGFPDDQERYWIDQAQIVGNQVLTELGIRSSLPGADRVWLVREPWEAQPIVNQSWVEYWGTRHCTSPEYTRPLGCVGGTALYDYAVILHLLPEIVDQYNLMLGPDEQQWRRDRCFYSLHRMVRFYFHEMLHVIGYSHGSEMTGIQEAMQQRFDEIYGSQIREEGKWRCSLY